MIIRRKKRRSGRKDEKTGGILALRLFFMLSFFLVVYLVGALVCPWTGLWGRSLGDFILGLSGGATVIPLFFLAYSLFALGTGRKITSPLRQIGGTGLLFICGAILTGIMSMTGPQPRVLTPGIMGTMLAGLSVEWIGALGTLIVGISLTALSAYLYGISAIRPEAVLGWIQGMVLRFRARLPRRPLADEYDSSEDVSLDWEDEPVPEISIRTVSPENSDELLDGDLYEDQEEESFPVEDYREEVLSDDNEEESCFSDEENDEEKRSFSDASTVSREENHELDDDEIDEEDLPEEETDPTGPFPPPMDLFGPGETGDPRNDPMILRQKGLDIVSALSSFGVDAELARTVEGPTVIQYQIQLAPGVKVSKVAGLSKDIAVALAVPSLRVEAPIPGTSYVGIEVPNKKRRPVTLRSVMESEEFSDSDVILPLPLGFRVDGSPLVVGLEELPHLLVAGTTGSGKSVFVTSCITAMCATRTPAELRFILVDPKRVEMAIYEKLPHVLAKPIVDPQKAIHALGWAVREMERRYEVFARTRVRQLSGYNQKVLPKDRLPHIVIVVDELADLMFTASKEVEDFICRLAQMARATGIHLILATQRPSVNVITGLIKANVPARVAFTLPSQTDSRTIIDVTGAQQLLGKGDMLFSSTKFPRPIRIQSPFIDEDTTLQVIDSLRRSFGDPEYVELEDQQNGKGGRNVDFSYDDRLEEAIRFVLGSGIASASRLQRQMRVGFTRAARMIDTMEQMGIIGPQDGSKPREIYVDEERAEEILEEYL
ncbi:MULTISPECIES: FtsK/SpoIIIE family DNA translocase [Dethiosulfovibrio]|uniref:DNA translocase FtsK n=2 Tax=Dethiosulfovibrio TaxID=47054 RepID=A0ABS9ELP0_9BACT|nr:MULTISPECIES: DNA translocase FtsK [Dethiosulfovibrio]MCF4113652.1 DNA translocase FtsK [Dethiosulfovibrio russensis]MCF4142122.1 DNA translocase FtsK [Dethiosulfovibrio marinus]